MDIQASKPASIVVHDTSVLGSATVEVMRKKGLAVRETSWAELELSNALGIVTIPPASGETVSQVARRARRVLDAAREQGARVVQCHHPGALGRGIAGTRLDADDRSSVDTCPYFHHEYVREMETYRYLEGGLHVVPVVIGHCIDRDGSNDWGLGEGLEEWSEYLHVTDRALDVATPDCVAAGLVAALQQARPGRRYVFGGSGISTSNVATALGVELHGPISLDAFGRAATKLGQISPASRSRLIAGIEPLLFGPVIDSTRARGELGYMPRAPVF